MTTDELLKKEARKHLDEGRDRLHKCLGMLSTGQIWRRANANTVSVGNLVLHLCGNVGQWINAKLGDDADARDRDREFSTEGPIALSELLARLDRTVDRAMQVIDGLDETRLHRTVNVQAFSVNGVGILVHVVEHFSYHVGQVTLHTKLMLDVDTGYYAGKDLNRKP